MESKSKQLLRILALHGYRQSGDVFSAKLGGLRKRYKRTVEFTFITAPHQVPKMKPDDESEDQMYGWWFNTKEHEFKATIPSDSCFGFEESLALVEKTFKESGPFDGIIGFSQGAAFTSIICAMKQKQMTPVQFDFAILAAGFPSLCAPHSKFYEEKISIPSLHVYGTGDQIIPTEMARQLDDTFLEPKKVVLHEGGHYLGKDSMYSEYLKDALQRKNAS